MFEDHIVYQIKNSMGGLPDKNEGHIERAHKDGERIEMFFCELTNFQLSQMSQLKNNDMMTNPKVKLKSD